MGREIVSKAVIYNGVPPLADMQSLINTYIANPNIDTGWSQLGSILILMLRYVDSVAGGGGGGLVDGNYGDVTVSGSGTVISYNSNSVANADMAQMATLTLKGNDSGVSATPQDLTVPEVQLILSVDDLITLTGIVEGGVNLGSFTGAGLPVLTNLTIKQAFQAIKDILVLATTSVNGLMSFDDFQKLRITNFTFPVSSVSWDTNTGHRAFVQANSNITINQPTNYVNGDVLTLLITAVGADRTITFSPSFKNNDGTDIGSVVIPSGTGKTYQFIISGLGLHSLTQPASTSSSGQTTYDAGNGMIVTATDAGITFARTSATEWAVTIPDGVDIISGQIYSTTAQNPGANCYIAFNFGGTRPFNTNTAGTNARPPKHMWGINMAGNGDGTTPISRVNPQAFAVTTGATNLLPRVTAVGSGDIEIEIQNYTTALGASASLVMFNF